LGRPPASLNTASGFLRMRAKSGFSIRCAVDPLRAVVKPPTHSLHFLIAGKHRLHRRILIPARPVFADKTFGVLVPPRPETASPWLSSSASSPVFTRPRETACTISGTI
jgi:hypothetical protein